MCQLARFGRFLMLAVLTSLLSPLQEGYGQTPARKFEDTIKIEFPKDGYSFTVAEAVKGVKLSYRIVVEQDHDGVAALPFGPSFHEPAGASGLHPREQISGNKQLYCLLDSGLAPPPKETVRPLKKGAYAHSFEWDGRNWTGPSDFNNPKGKPFPAGTYDVTVLLHGKVKTEKGLVPYQITQKTRLILK